MRAVTYSGRVRRHFARPRHAGDADGPSAAAARGDTQVVLSAQTDGERLAAVRFRVRGCPHTIAAAEEACRAFEGRPAAALREFPVAEIMQNLEIPVEKTGLILLLEDAAEALHRAITN